MTEEELLNIREHVEAFDCTPQSIAQMLIAEIDRLRLIESAAKDPAITSLPAWIESNLLNGSRTMLPAPDTLVAVRRLVGLVGAEVAG